MSSFRLFDQYGLNQNVIVIFDHNFGGGANFYRDEVIELHLKKGMAVVSFERNIGRQHFISIFFAGKKCLLRSQRLDEFFLFLEKIRCQEIFVNNLVYFFDPLNVVVKIREYVIQKNITLTIPIHDFFCVCPSHNLLNYSGRFCEIPDLNVCDFCLPKIKGNHEQQNSIVDIRLWRKEWLSLLKIATQILFFSESSVNLFRRAYPQWNGKNILYKPHEVHFDPVYLPEINRSEPLHIGVFGSIAFHKGSEVIFNLARYLKETDSKVLLTVVGTLEGYDDLNMEQKSQFRVRVLGHYHRDDLPRLIQRYKINFSLLPTILPETFSYIVSELIILKIPVAVFDFGAQAEKVRKYDQGLVLSSFDPDKIISEIIRHVDV